MDAVFRFTPLPKIPVMLLFWDADAAEGFDARVKLLFDETITTHLDIESILFLSERIRQMLCGDPWQAACFNAVGFPIGGSRQESVSVRWKLHLDTAVKNALY